MKGILKCNTCAAQNCPVSSKQMKNLTDSSTCGAYRHSVPFSAPMLMHLVYDPAKVNALKEVLSQHDLQIRERLQYPFFTLVTKNG